MIASLSPATRIHAAGDQATSNRLARIFPFEILAALTIVAVLMSSAWLGYRDAVYKAGVSEVMSAIRAKQIDAIEQFAVDGEWPGTGIDRAAGADDEARVPDYERMLRKPELQARQERDLGGRKAGSPGGARVIMRGLKVGVSQGSILAIWQETRTNEIYALAFRPAVPAAGGATVRWLCGNSDLPSGWIAPPALAFPSPPDAWLVATCRRSRTR